MGTALARIVMAAAILSGCASEKTGELFVDVRTDLAIGREFDGVRTEVWRERPVMATPPLHRGDPLPSPADDYMEGQRVAEIRGLPLATYWVRVSLVLDGSPAIAGLVSTTIDGPTTLTVLLTRSCAGVVCPPADGNPALTTCVAGECVDPRCAADMPELCPEPECVAAADCESRVACVEAVCSEGSCLLAPRDDR